jgi:outer membrane protein OmpA-like peptidoglycan-associated protein
MVQPDRAPAKIARAGLLASLALTGCAVVPKSRLDEAAKVTQALRAENAQLRDQALSLRSDNEDLSERALGDARRIAALEQSVDRLETSVQGYIDEREDMVDKYERFRRLARVSTGSDLSAKLNDRLRRFASAHPGTTFDEASGVVSVASDTLFAPGSDRLRPEASRWLDDCAAILADAEARPLPMVVSARPPTDSAVRLASTDRTATPPTDLARAQRVRDALASRAGRDPARVGVAGLGASRSASGPGRIEIALGGEGTPGLSR